MQQLFFLSVVLLTVAVGCSSTKFVRADFEKRVGVVRPRFQEEDIQKNFEKKINLPKPFTIAVYFKDPERQHGTPAWRWDLKEKQSFLKKMRESVDKEMVSGVFLMDETIDERADLYKVRLAASKYGADSVLIVQAASDTIRENTRWAASYALVLPILFVNGNKVDAHFSINASLWDVRTEMLYMSMSSEGTDTDKYPAVWWKPDSEYIEKTKEIALNNLMSEMGEDFSALKSRQSVQ